MKQASKNLEFEKAAVLRRQIFGLKHIQDVALISESPLVASGQSLPAGRQGIVAGYRI